MGLIHNYYGDEMGFCDWVILFHIILLRAVKRKNTQFSTEQDTVLWKKFLSKRQIKHVATTLRRSTSFQPISRSAWTPALDIIVGLVVVHYGAALARHCPSCFIGGGSDNQEKRQPRDEFSGARIEINAESTREQQVLLRRARLYVHESCWRSCRKQLLGIESVYSLNATNY